MEWINNAVRRWCNDQRQEVIKTGSRAHNCFYKRSSVSAWRMTVLLYHLWCMAEGLDEGLEMKDEGKSLNPKLSAQPNGMLSQERTLNLIRTKCVKFYRFMATYILEGLLTQWGKTYDQMHKHDEDGDTQKLSLYDQMPHQFSRDQLNEQCVKLGLSSGRIFLHKWKKAKLIYQPDSNEEIYIKNY